MNDTIYRQAAIEAMANTLWHYPSECYRNLNSYEFAKALAELGLKSVPSAQPYTDEEIQKIQDLEQAQLDKAYEFGRQSAQPEPCEDAVSRKLMYELGATCMARRDENGELVALGSLDALPSAQPEIIRCKNCTWWSNDEYRECSSPNYDNVHVTPAGFYCGWAERRTDD